MGSGKDPVSGGKTEQRNVAAGLNGGVSGLYRHKGLRFPGSAGALRRRPAQPPSCYCTPLRFISESSGSGRCAAGALEQPPEQAATGEGRTLQVCSVNGHQPLGRRPQRSVWRIPHAVHNGANPPPNSTVALLFEKSHRCSAQSRTPNHPP